MPARRVEISLTQLLAGSAAAVCGAWLASRIGLAGTVIGAGVVSALVTVLSAVYAHGARRARERLLARRELLRLRGPGLAGAQTQTGVGDAPAAVSDPPSAHAPGQVPDQGPGQVPDQVPGGPSQGFVDDDALTGTNPLFLPPFDLEDSGGYRWGRIAVAALAVFALGMGAVTVLELVSGNSFACTTAGIGCDQGTTVPIPGRARRTTEPTSIPSVKPTGPTASPSATASPSLTGTVSPTASPSSSASTGSPSPTASGTGSPSPSSTTSGSQSPTAG